MSRYRVQVTKVMYYDKVYYNIKTESKLLLAYKEYCDEIGDEAYIIDGELYIDEGAYFNICMKDTESTFIEQ